MPFILIKGRFKPTVGAPDGDSVRFLASILALWKKLDGTPVRLVTSDKSKHIDQGPPLKGLEAIKATSSRPNWFRTPFIALNWFQAPSPRSSRSSFPLCYPPSNIRWQDLALNHANIVNPSIGRKS